jgi:hypothetical protein
MSKIMPFYTKRKEMGVLVLDFNKLRAENDASIKEERKYGINWERFKNLVNFKPISKSCSKESFSDLDRLHFETRDAGICFVCGSVYHYGSCNMYSGRDRTYNLSHLHHVVPNGCVSDKNIVTLCVHCHQMVHQAMHIEGTWKYGRPL